MDISDYYGENADREEIAERYAKVREKAFSLMKKEPDFFFSSSGRAEIIGNHTDHERGKVVVSAITCDVVCAVKKRDDKRIEIYSEGFAPIRFSLNDTEPRADERGRSVALARGVMAALKKRKYRFGGFTAYTQSNIFRGAGVSSSAAFEVLLAEIVNHIYLGGALTAYDKAAVGQFAENVYFGKPCGLLDQTGVALGGMNAVDFKDPLRPVCERLTPPEGYTVVIVNSGGSHAALTEHYAAIRAEMEQVAAYFHKKVLREVSYKEFFASLPALRGKVSERALLRAFHFFDENRRVELAADALKRGDTAAFLKQIDESGQSSLVCLQNAFVPGSVIQPIPLAMKISKEIVKDGAVRLHGGGFCGTILAYVADGEASGYQEEMAKVFGKENVFSTQTRNIGASVIDLQP